MTVVRLGRFADGAEMSVALDQAHVLIAGLSGTGKSSTLRTLLVGAARDPTVALVLVDAKRVELTAWRPRATCVFTEPDAISAGLSRVAELVDDRYCLMEANGATSWPVSTTTPRILVVVDELAALTASGDKPRDKAHTSALRHVLERGRAAGVVVVAAIQRPAADVVPTSVRDLFQLRILHALSDRTSVEMAAGAAWTTSPAHTLPVGPQHGGLCFAVLEGAREGQLARTYWVTPEQAEALAVRCVFSPPVAGVVHRPDCSTCSAEAHAERGTRKDHCDRTLTYSSTPVDAATSHGEAPRSAGTARGARS